MRFPRTARALVALCAVLAVAATCLVVERALPAYVSDTIRVALAARGISDAQFRVLRVRWNRIRLVDVRLGRDVDAEAVELAFDASGLLGGHVTSVTLEGARWTTLLDEEELASSTVARLIAVGPPTPGDSPTEIRVVRSRVVIGHAGGATAIELDGSFAPRDERGVFQVRSPLGEHEVAVRAHVEGGALALGLDVRDQGSLALAVEVSGPASPSAPSSIPLAWSLDARLPPALLQRAMEIELEGETHVKSAGLARRSSPRAPWVIEEATLDAEVARARWPSAEIEIADARAELHFRGTAGEQLALEVIAPSRVHLGRAKTPEVDLEQVAITPRVHVEGTGDALRVHAGEQLAVAIDAWSLGQGAARLSFEDVRLTIAAREGRPLFETSRETTRWAMRADGRAPRLRGLLAGRAVRGRATLDAEMSHGELTLRAPLHLELARVSEASSETVLTRARLDAVLVPNADGKVTASGRARADDIAWRGVALGPVGGSVRLTPTRVLFDWTGRATRDAAFRARASIGLRHGRGHLDVVAPPSIVRDGDALQRVLASVSEMRVTGRVGGEAHVDLRSLERSTARVTLDKAVVTRADGGRAHDVHGTITLGSLEPAASAAPDLVAWRELHLGDLGTLGRGSARVALEPSGDIVIRDAIAALSGGTVRAALFRIDHESSDLRLDLELQGIELRRLLAAATEGRATGNGRLDGRLGVRVVLGSEPRIVLGVGHLRARDRGHIRVGPERSGNAPRLALEHLRTGQWIEGRMLEALSDFEYSRLALDLVRDEGAREGGSRLVARVAGRGARIPQELDLTLNVRGIQPVMDEAVRLWP